LRKKDRILEGISNNFNLPRRITKETKIITFYYKMSYENYLKGKK